MGLGEQIFRELAMEYGLKDYFDKYGFDDGMNEEFGWEYVWRVCDMLNELAKKAGTNIEFVINPFFGSSHNCCRIQIANKGVDEWDIVADLLKKLDISEDVLFEAITEGDQSFAYEKISDILSDNQKGLFRDE